MLLKIKGFLIGETVHIFRGISSNERLSIITHMRRILNISRIYHGGVLYAYWMFAQYYYKKCTGWIRVSTSLLCQLVWASEIEPPNFFYILNTFFILVEGFLISGLFTHGLFTHGLFTKNYRKKINLRGPPSRMIHPRIIHPLGRFTSGLFTPITTVVTHISQT